MYLYQIDVCVNIHKLFYIYNIVPVRLYRFDRNLLGHVRRLKARVQTCFDPSPFCYNNRAFVSIRFGWSSETRKARARPGNRHARMFSSSSGQISWRDKKVSCCTRDPRVRFTCCCPWFFFSLKRNLLFSFCFHSVRRSLISFVYYSLLGWCCNSVLQQVNKKIREKPNPHNAGPCSPWFGIRFVSRVVVVHSMSKTWKLSPR